MGQRVSIVLAALALLLLAGCPAPDPATEITVEVTCGAALASDLRKLRIRVVDDASKVTRRESSLDLTKQPKRPGGTVFPLSFSLSSPSGEATKFRLVVTGLGGKGKAEDELVEAQARAQFQPNKRQLLTIHLLESCRDLLCREAAALTDQTCVDGTCKTVPTPKTEIIEPGPYEGKTDPAVGVDGGGKRNDAGQDGAGNDAARPPQDATVTEQSCRADPDCQELADKAQPEGCVVATCEGEKCVLKTADADGDGHQAKACAVEGSEVQLGDDCDDADNARFPGAWDGPEVDDKPAACDKRDNDCDGQVDEDEQSGKSCTCDPVADAMVDCSERDDGTAITWPSGAPLGRCRYGKRSCRDGKFTACVGAIEPAARDTCAPDDDSDCDGEKNESCTCSNGATQSCGSDVGDCRPGTQTCVNGAWTACTGAIGPRGTDTCEPNSDRDCNGKPNEGCECVNGASSTCGKALGAKGDCAGRTILCSNGRWPAQQCNPTAAEVCNADGRDENCDGVVNERRVCECTNGERQSCLAIGWLGVCAAQGRVSCSAGEWGTCSVGRQNGDRCVAQNLLTGAGDENCNGFYREGCGPCNQGDRQSCNIGTCTGGTQTCDASGRWGSCLNCTEPPPPPDPPPEPEPEPAALVL